MFYYCTGLKGWNIELPQLTNGYYMFYCCYSLKSWNIELPSLTNGYYMFNQCKGLISFASDLSNLTNGSDMFTACKLDKTSVLRILNTIPTYSSGTRTITIGAAKSCEGDEEIAAAITNAQDNKLWTVAISYNG